MQTYINYFFLALLYFPFASRLSYLTLFSHLYISLSLQISYLTLFSIFYFLRIYFLLHSLIDLLSLNPAILSFIFVGLTPRFLNLRSSAPLHPSTRKKRSFHRENYMKIKAPAHSKSRIVYTVTNLNFLRNFLPRWLAGKSF